MRTASLLVLLLLPACALLDFTSGDVAANASSDQVLLSNGTEERVYYIILGRKAAARARWGQHLDSEISVKPGGRKKIPYRVFLYEGDEEEEAVVYWWHAEQSGDERVPGEVHSLIVKL